MQDIAPIASISREAVVIVVNPSLPAKTLPELIAYAKSNPDKISMGSAGIGSTGHLAGELFKIMAGVNLIHVPYRGNAPALIDRTESSRDEPAVVSAIPAAPRRGRAAPPVGPRTARLPRP